jgi:RHS repeat-associated protein
LTPTAGPGDSFTVTAAPVEVSFTNQSKGRPPVTLKTKEGLVSLDLLAASEKGATVKGQGVHYPEVLPGVDVIYEATGDGVKETLILASAVAPDSYTYRITHSGFELRRDKGGEWALYPEGAAEATYVLGALSVYDSSKDEDGAPAYCEGAELAVAPGLGMSTVTYTVPREWLDDAARVWPVEIDPSLFTRNPTDTYISYGYPNNSYGSGTELWSGKWDTASNVCETLVKFPQVNTGIPADAYIANATFKIRQFWQPDPNHDLTHVYRIGASSSSWSESSTWNSTTLSDCVLIDDVSVAGDAWLSVHCEGAVQYWLQQGASANKGFLIARKNSSEGSSYRRKFRSGEYSNAEQRPTLEVDWYQPEVVLTQGPEGEQLDGQAHVYRPGEVVHVRIALGNIGGENERIQEVRLGINRLAASEAERRGCLTWCRGGIPFASEAWKTYPYETAEDGYLSSYENDTDVHGTGHITPLWERCEFNQAAGAVDFYFRINRSFGASTGNRFTVRATVLTPDGERLWEGDWTDIGPSFDVQEPVAATVDGTDWFTETAAPGGSLSDALDEGRGQVSLSWPQVERADGYEIYLFDGAAHVKVAQTVGGDATSWSTAATLPFAPSDSEIDAVGASDAWPAGPQASGKSPFYRATTPSAASRTDVVSSTALAGSAGVVASDGTYVYARNRRGWSGGPTKWQRFTAAGVHDGELATSPTAVAPLTGFAFDGYLYSGVASASGGTATISGVSTIASGTRTLTLSARPLDRNTGSMISSSAVDESRLLLAATPDGQWLYSVSHTLTNTGGVSNYDGYKILLYALDAQTNTATYVGSAVSLAMDSKMIGGLMLDETSLYLIAWGGATPITRIDREALEDAAAGKHPTQREIVIENQWLISQSSGQPLAGAGTGAFVSGDGASAADDCFWLGALDAGNLYRCAGASDGLPLRDNPSALYGKVATEAAAWTHYSFKVVPYRGVALSSLPGGYRGTIVTLPKRTVHVNEAPRAASAELPSFAGHEAALRLDGGLLELATTDLAVASFGPQAALERHYLSERQSGVTTSYFAPGWRFGFERRLDLADQAAGEVRYLDGRGETWRFAGSGSSLAGPYASCTTLSLEAGTWTLLRKDQSGLTFDAQGRLASEFDAQGNSVSYTWDGSTHLTITAANGQALAVSFDQGAITGAVYEASEQLPALREVAYTLASGSGTVTFQASAQDPAERSRSLYLYSSGKLAEIKAEAPDGAGWTQVGRQCFSYTDGALTKVELPEKFAPTSPTVADAEIDVVHSAPGTTALTTHGRIEGAPADITTIYAWSEQGSLDAVTGPYAAGVEDAPPATRFVYAPSGDLAATTTPLGNTSHTAYDTRGNPIASQDALGRGTATAYYGAATSQSDLPQATLAADGGLTRYSYNDARQLLESESETDPEQLQRVDPSLPPVSAPELATPSDNARSTATYSDVSIGSRTYHGALVSASTYLTESDETAVTTYADFHISGQAETVTEQGVKLSSSAAATDLVTTHIYDGFGQLLTTSNASDPQNPVVLLSNTYDALGNLTRTSGPAFAASEGGPSYQVETHYRYNSLTQLVESYETTSDAQLQGTYVNWTRRSVSPGGWVMGEQFLDGEDVQSETVLKSITSTYDGRGLLYRRNDSTVGGRQAEHWYDARGNLTRSRPEGRRTASDFHATERFAYDSDSRRTHAWMVGGDLTNNEQAEADHPSVSSSYDAADQLIFEERRDGSWSRFEYDAGGRLVATRSPTEGYDSAHLANVALATHRFNLSGDPITSHDAARTKTVYEYDRAGRLTRQALFNPQPIGEEISETASTTSTYNSLGWPLAEEGIEQVSMATTYDAFGRVRSHVEGKVRRDVTYNDAGQRLRSESGPLGDPFQATSYATTAYDSFGRSVAEVGGPVGEDAARTAIMTTYDSLGRTLTETKSRGSGTSEHQLYARSYVYPLPGGTQDSLIERTTYGRSVAADAGDAEQLITQDVTIDARDSDDPLDLRAVAGRTPHQGGSPPAEFTYEIAGRDVADRVIGIDMAIEGTTPGLHWTYSYTTLGRLQMQAGTGYGTSSTDTYTYDADSGRLERRAMDFLDNTNLHGDIDVSYTYSESGRLTTTASGGSTTTHTFNGGGSLTKVQDTDTTTFSYTPRQRLNERKDNGTLSKVFLWDEDAQSQEQYGRRLSEGPTQQNQTRSFTWAADGRLSTINDAGGASSTYTYDGNGQRLRRVLTQGAETTTIDYTYDGLTLLALSASVVETASQQETGRYSVCYLYDAEGQPYGAYYEECAVWGGTPGAVSGAWCATLTDLRGDVIELLDANGNRFASYRYSVWGVPQGGAYKSVPSSAIAGDLEARIAERQELRYAGYVYDAAHELYYCSARYYDPRTRSFISRDPAKADGAESAYQYCSGNPVLSADPSGERPDIGDGYYARWNPSERTWTAVDVWTPAQRQQYSTALNNSYNAARAAARAYRIRTNREHRLARTPLNENNRVNQAQRYDATLGNVIAGPRGHLSSGEAASMAGKWIAWNTWGGYEEEMRQYMSGGQYWGAFAAGFVVGPGGKIQGGVKLATKADDAARGARVVYKNGWRDLKGCFVSPRGAGRPGVAAETAVWDAIVKKRGWSVRRGNVAVRNSSGQLRYYDGAAISPSGRVIGLEVKSGGATRNGAQRTFDAGVNAGDIAFGVGRSEGTDVVRSLLIRVP